MYIIIQNGFRGPGYNMHTTHSIILPTLLYVHMPAVKKKLTNKAKWQGGTASVAIAVTHTASVVSRVSRMDGVDANNSSVGASCLQDKALSGAVAAPLEGDWEGRLEINNVTV